MSTTLSVVVEQEATAREVFRLRCQRYGKGWDAAEFDTYSDAQHAGLQQMAVDPSIDSFLISKVYRRVAVDQTTWSDS